MLIPLAYARGFACNCWPNRFFLLYGLTGVAMFYALQNAGLNYTSVTNTVMILASIPALTTVLAVIFLREKLNQWQSVSLIMVTLGVVIVALAGMEPSEYSPNPVLGNLLIFASAVAWAVYTIQGKKIIVQRPALVITAANMGTGLLFLAPLTAWEILREHQAGAAGLGAVSAGGWAGVFYLGVVATALTFFLWNFALRYLPASVVSPYISLEPIIGLFSGLLIGESIFPVQVVGGSMAILGVWLSSRSAPERYGFGRCPHA
jgi:drug/metabolite transporter (DMT)-like permease